MVRRPLDAKFSTLQQESALVIQIVYCGHAICRNNPVASARDRRLTRHIQVETIQLEIGALVERQISCLRVASRDDFRLETDSRPASPPLTRIA